MYPQYEESSSIMEVIPVILQRTEEKISGANTIQDALYSIRILHDILQFRTRFLDHIPHGGSRTGFNFDSENLFYDTGKILVQGSKANLDDIKKTVLGRLQMLVRCLEPFSLTHLFRMPKWKYHHPRPNAPQYFYSYAHNDYVPEKCVDIMKGSIPYQVRFWVDKADLRRFQKIPEELSNAIDNSQAAILMFSPNYLESKWCNLEWQAALERNITEQSLRLYVIMIHKCKLPALLKPYYCTNLIEFPSPEAFLELMKLIDDIIEYERLAG